MEKDEIENETKDMAVQGNDYQTELGVIHAGANVSPRT